MEEHQYVEVRKSPAVGGMITVQGSKNSALAIVAAACLNDNLVRLKNVPDLRDFRIIKTMLSEVGILVNREDEYFVVDAKNVTDFILDYNISADFRASYYFIAAILKQYNKVSLSYPGGDDFGSRPIDQHFKGIEKLGGRIEKKSSYYTVHAEKLIGNQINFEVITSGATINMMLIATLAEGVTTLTNSATDPEVVDVANFLNLMGHRVVGAGADKISIYPKNGVTADQLTYSVIPDRLIAGSLLMLPGIVGGEVTVKNAIPEHLTSVMHTLENMGLEITQTDFGLRSRKVGELQGARCVTGMYPLFATDLQQPLTALMLYANSDSSVQDNVYYNRFSHLEELKKMGVELNKTNNIAYIQSRQCELLNGDNDVNCRDVRAGTCLLFTALGTKGVTRLHDVKHLFRGYENLVGDLRSLGMNISLKEVQ